MLHRMKLRREPFASMAAGKKNVELRLHDEKRQVVLPGDTIEFTQVQTGQVLLAMVTGKRVFADFAGLYVHYDKIRLGYGPEEAADPRDMEQYYDPAEIAKYGVVAIELELLPEKETGI